jgi:recombination protein RecA
MESIMAKKTTTVAAPLNGEKAKAVEAAIAQIEKNYGKGAIMTLGSQPVEDIPVIPSGCIQLDMALGVGGFPRGRIIEIFGPESSGKTTLTLHAIAEAQKLGGTAALLMLNTLLMLFMQENSALILNHCLFLNQTLANKLLILQKL